MLTDEFSLTHYFKKDNYKATTQIGTVVITTIKALPIRVSN